MDVNALGSTRHADEAIEGAESLRDEKGRVCRARGKLGRNAYLPASCRDHCSWSADAAHSSAGVAELGGTSRPTAPATATAAVRKPGTLPAAGTQPPSPSLDRSSLWPLTDQSRSFRDRPAASTTC